MESRRSRIQMARQIGFGFIRSPRRTRPCIPLRQSVLSMIANVEKQKVSLYALYKNHTRRGGEETGIDAVRLAHKLDTSQVLRYVHAFPPFFLMHIFKYSNFLPLTGLATSVGFPKPYCTICSLSLLGSCPFPLRPRSVALSRLSSKAPLFFRTCCFAAAATAGLCCP